MAVIDHAESAFYIAGGNLEPGARSYVVRPADNELFEAIRDGHYSYVLTSRQMGKSSLMHRTAVHLEEAGITPILIDLTGIGANLSVEQWYRGLLTEVGRQVGLTTEMERLWNDSPQHGPLYRFTRTLTEVALARSDRPIAIFIDEIDFVRGLRNFSTDEFFAAIRQCYNSRASVPAMRRLTFCLLGVATPADLIRDVRTTPFNIGRQIELTDFTIDEALPLAPGLDPNPSIAIRKLQRIFEWTNGHPYLTQKLCLAASERRECPLSEIDRICHSMFLSSGVRRSEDNLIFVHNTLRNGLEDHTPVIGMYRRVLTGKFVPNDPADPVVALLRLAGVVRAENGRLVVRNHIYARVFDRRWAEENLPDAALRRERAAFRKGVGITVAVSAAIIGIMCVLIYRTVAARREAQQADARLLKSLDQANYLLGMQDLVMANQALKEDNWARASALLQSCRDIHSVNFAGRFPWRYLWAQCHDRQKMLPGHTAGVEAMTFKDSHQTLITASADQTIKFWDVALGQPLRTLPLGVQPKDAAFSADSKTALFVDATLNLRRIDLKTGNIEVCAVLPAASAPIYSVCCSSDGRYYAGGNGDGSVAVWSATSRLPLHVFQGQNDLVTSVALSPDGRYVAAVTFGKMVNVWDTRTGLRLNACGQAQGDTMSVCFTPNGLLATACLHDGTRLWDLKNPQTPKLAIPQDGPARSITFSRDGSIFVTCDFDSLDYIWKLNTPPAMPTLLGRRSRYIHAAISPDDTMLATAAPDGNVMVSQVTSPPNFAALDKPFTDAMWFAITTDMQSVIEVSSSGEISAWSTMTGKQRWTRNFERPCFFATSVNLLALQVDDKAIIVDTKTGVTTSVVPDCGKIGSPIKLSSDGRLLAVSDRSGAVRVYDLNSHLQICVLQGKTAPAQIIIAPDSRRIAVVRHTNHIEIWDSTKAKILSDFHTPSGSCGSGAFSPDSNTFASIEPDGIQLWHIGKNEMGRRLNLGIPAENIAFSPDGSTLAIGDTGAVTLCDVSSGQQILSLHEGTGGICDLAFSPDGATLMSVGDDNNVRRWSGI